ncbi:suppressor of fused domain protein [Corynebacterium sp.]|uniref:suppressor of fused domain protein n=1 Tax=Corynebacterium sp. TaxID=1720 RepID=UPI0026DAEA2E|nr:suppressor of fused domain protein [Corynebacterium sp.]MDO5031824.1 suppressor of fused domain protein [Corynebacterium sp.]
MTHVERGVDVRCELLTVARAEPAAAVAAVLSAARLLARAKGVVPAQPGVLLPELFPSDDPRFTSFSVRHGLLIAPFLWGGQTPQVVEENRVTVVCQLLMLSDAEYAYAVEEGVGAMQQAVADAGIDVLDWRRR